MLFLLVLFLALASAKPWPNQFSINFKTLTGIPGTLFYNWDIQRQRIDHAGGSSECVKFYHTQSPCSLYFDASQVLRIYFPQNNTCCTDSLRIGVPPPSWTSNATYMGKTGCPPCGTAVTTCNHYTGEGDNGVHHYWSTVGQDVPCVFTFPNNPEMMTIYDVTTFDVSPQDSKLFKPPADCSRPC